MTLVLSVNGPESIWLLADRRLSYTDGRPARNDACKILEIGSSDGMALIGYAGLGATASGMEPSEWASNTLRGRDLPIEEYLGVLATVASRELPLHIENMGSHVFMVTAFVAEEARFYYIDVARQPNGNYELQFVRRTRRADSTKKLLPPHFGLAGSGTGYLEKRLHWMRPLARLVRAYDQQRISAYEVADHLAALNNEVSQNVPTVGARSIVIWRNRQKGVYKGGGGVQFYTGGSRDDSSPGVPNIIRGHDFAAMFAAQLPIMQKAARDWRSGKVPNFRPDTEELNAKIKELPDKPDEKLR